MLGWLAAGMLSLLLASPAWGLDLDLDQEITRQEADASQILNTLGRDRKATHATTKGSDQEDEVQVKLVKATKPRKRI